MYKNKAVRIAGRQRLTVGGESQARNRVPMALKARLLSSIDGAKKDDLFLGSRGDRLTVW